MEHIRFDGSESTVILACTKGAPPALLYWGARLLRQVEPQSIVVLGMMPGGPGSSDQPITASLALETGLGLLGPAGLLAHRGGRDWGSLFRVVDVVQAGDRAHITCCDEQTQLGLDYDIAFDLDSGVLAISSVLTNTGDDVVDLVDMATACLPVPSHMDQVIGFSGRWSGEFHRENIARFTGGYVRENRRGRTSHDSFPAIILATADTNEASGEAYGFHLAWSGNHRLRVDTLIDGRVIASMGALFFPGEVRLAAGERYQSPQIVASYSPSGLSALSRNFHTHVREKLLRPSTRAKPRPVHYNSWEAVYFDHDIAKLKAMADRAAAIGVERFVLDDGWFGSRRHDRAGLGDWTVSGEVYPDGLGPLIDHVTSLGMEMGIWFEPEMVNPDSDLYRAHPDWVLRIDGLEQIAFRNQYALDISRRDVAEYLFEQLDAILSAYRIGYIKWDMNRDLNHPGGVGGCPRAHAQVEALYALIDRVRAAHPAVEIESCSSGGGRPDMGILARTDRVWTSDSNDAIDRQAIQRGASFFLPLNVIGAHVGPQHCHITRRTLPMGLRAATALMGHMGLELNLLTEAADDLDELARAIALYKTHRALLHSGDFYRLDTPDYLNVVGVVAVDKSEALYSVAMLSGHRSTVPGKVYFAGLNPQRRYSVTRIWPTEWRAKPRNVIEAAGDALAKAGLQLPLIDPETIILFHIVERASAANT